MLFKAKKVPIVNIIVQLSIFLFTFIFFTKIFPLIPYDGDDWYFLGAMRNPYPMWGVFNPSKVLPETLESLAGYFGAFVIYPFSHNYIASLSIASVLVISIIITILMILTYKFIRTHFKLSKLITLSLELFFYLSFFLIFKKGNEASYFGFWCQDLNCYFNYLIPGCLNACLLLYLDTANSESYQFTTSHPNYFIIGILIVTIYFAMFSSIQMNIILASYSIATLLFNHLKKENITLQIKQLINEWPFILIILFWLTSLIFDVNGGRAANVSQNIGLINAIKAVLIQYRVMIQYTNKFFLIVCLLFIGFAFVIFCQSIHSDKAKSYFKILLASILTVAFFTLLYTKAPVTYASRPDAMWAVIFFGLLLTIQGLALLLIKYQVCVIFMPLSLIIMSLISFNLNYGYVFKDNSDAFTSYKVGNHIVNTIVTAEHNGKSVVKVKVPKSINNDNWPHPLNQAQWMQNTLYAHGLIRHRIKVIFVPDRHLNKQMYPQGESEPFNDLEAH